MQALAKGQDDLFRLSRPLGRSNDRSPAVVEVFLLVEEYVRIDLLDPSKRFGVRHGLPLSSTPGLTGAADQGRSIYRSVYTGSVGSGHTECQGNSALFSRSPGVNFFASPREIFRHISAAESRLPAGAGSAR